MANYLVTYRKADGKQAQENFSAEDRAELFRILGKRGISARRIEETVNEKARKPGDGSAKKSTLVKYALSAMVAIVAVVAGVFWFASGDEPEQKPSKEIRPKKRIVEQKPAKPTPLPKAEPAPQPYKESPEELRRNGMWTDEDGNLRRRDGSYFFGKPNKEKPMQVDLRSRHPEQTAFKRSSEISIAHVLMIEPGEPIENWVKFGKRFNEDFKASLDEKIEILPDDDEYVKELKRAVIETKEELRRRMNQGEDVAEIINEARAELERLGQYREDIKQQVLEIAKDPELSDGDLEDLSKAADEMLKDKGVPTLSNSKIFKLQLRLAAKKAKEQK